MRDFFSQIGDWLKQAFVPTALATLIASGVSISSAINAAREQQETYNAKFESLVDDPKIIDTFNASDPQTVKEEKATAKLIALYSVAETELQRRTVLLIGAKLINADTAWVGTGADAARLLTLLINEADMGRNSWNPLEKAENDRLWETVQSPSFLNLVTAGYSNDYYNDIYTGKDAGAFRPYWPTLNGDEPISHDAKFQVLWELTRCTRSEPSAALTVPLAVAPLISPAGMLLSVPYYAVAYARSRPPCEYEGWVELATYKYALPQTEIAARGPLGKPVTRAVATDFITDATNVTLKRDVNDVHTLLTQYAIPDPRATPVITPLFTASQLVDKSQFPKELVMLRARLLRERPPVEYINPDGSFNKGSLGRIVGTVPAGSCVTVVEPLLPVLVFLPAWVIDNQPPPNPKSKAPVRLGGLVHMWAHVRAAKSDENCLERVGSGSP